MTYLIHCIKNFEQLLLDTKTYFDSQGIFLFHLNMTPTFTITLRKVKGVVLTVHNQIVQFLLKKIPFLIHSLNSGVSVVRFRELKQSRFWATDVNRKLKLLLFDTYCSLFVANFKL